MHQFNVLLTNKIMLSKTAAEGLGNVHEFVNDDFVLFCLRHTFESFEKFYGIMGRHVHGFLHQFADGVATGNRTFCAAATAPETFHAGNVDMFHCECLDYFSHALL